MAWFYKDGMAEIGPVDKEQLQQLIKSRKINAQTLIRNAGGQDWKLLSQFVRPKNPPPMEKATAAPVEVEQPLTMARESAPHIPSPPVPPPASIYCTQCGRSFPRDQVIEYNGLAICGACKPMFVQRMREGLGPATVMQFGGFWIRFAAKSIDGIILGILQWLIIIPMSLLFGTSISAAEGNALSPVSSCSSVCNNSSRFRFRPATIRSSSVK